MRVGLIGLSVLLIPTAAGEGPARGTICVASRAVTPFWGQVIPPTGEVSSGGLRVKVDQRPPIPWPQRESLKIEGLDSTERHLLAVVDAHGKTVESLWFRFHNLQQPPLVHVLRWLPGHRTASGWQALPMVSVQVRGLTVFRLSRQR